MNDAPSQANGVDFSWYLPLYEAGIARGCHSAGASTWTSPPLAFAYTTGGALSSRVTIPTCAVDSNGTPMAFNDVNFSWRPSADGTTNTVYAAVPRFDWKSDMGCQKVLGSPPAGATTPPTAGKTQPVVSPPNTLPQPPAGTDGISFAFSHDDFKSSCWTQSGSVLGLPLAAPGHPRLGQWQG